MPRLLMISTDRNIFEELSDVRKRQIEYAKNWDEVHIIVLEKKGKTKISNTKISPNCWVCSTNSVSKLTAPFTAIGLGRFITKYRNITEVTCQDPFLTAIPGSSLKRKFGITLEIQIHTDIGSPKYGFTLGNRIRKMLAKRHLPYADKVRIVSERIREFVTMLAPHAQIEVRPIFVDTESIKNAPIIEGADLHKKYPQFKRIILMASRIEPEKNIQIVIGVWSTIVHSIPSAGIIIVGSGSQLTHLKSKVSKLGLNNSVIFEPWVSKMTLYSYYKTADLFLNTSLFEGYGMTLVEATAAGCKVFSTDVGVAREIGAEII